MARTPPKAIISRNLRRLMDRESLSEAALSRRTGGHVSQKAINNILNQRQACTIETADKLARAFDLDLWCLFLAELPEDPAVVESIRRLYQSYSVASPEGRELIDKVAEREAAYSKPLTS